MTVPHSADDYYRQVQGQGNRFTPLLKLINPRSGSDWNHADLLTFRVLLRTCHFANPAFLKTHLEEAKRRLKNSDDFQALMAVLREDNWNLSPRTELSRSGKEFGLFLGFLDEAVEEPHDEQLLSGAPGVSAREKRNTGPVQYAPLPNEEEEPFNSGSSQTSDVSHEEQIKLKQQIKSESVANTLIIVYLQTLARCISDPKDESNERLD